MDSMEDINAKRDARRKRILENSEKRLLKITGRNSAIVPEAPSVHTDIPNQTYIPTDIENRTSHFGLNGKISVEGTVNTSTPLKQTSHILTNRINYVLLAVIVNILLILQLDHLFGQTITIPYFPIMLGRLYNYKNMQEMQDNSLLYPALILCNIKPELTYQLKRFITIVHMILEDLALYIFSFTLIHYGLLYCLHNTSILVGLNT
ncbi:uncharacterized protein LOC114879282 [Osmia bicornis bicornis]|uniref:uncharacterized protein LOC114879282 n=1 Tax=Osmia bicornis bicornis TaxID=1437191 RepID=UPI0010F4C46C|nr:uncharacterized protein LOC114879282 [Osmia bicornis bicornis]XP_029049905.1 uncharacterized protein LOC114879282 [Osmia bicornis bicornis]XP_029049906.1 uncharacterized protein LOC114879282 [Osmia bicornis bicornis]